MLRRPLFLVLLALGVGVYVSLPPRARALPDRPAGLAQPARGVIHVHTRRSDGGGTIDQVAAAAARAGLQFVILTDHGDATRAPVPPAYRDGVLVIDAVEVSTEGGHVVALGLPKSPYPLAGEARDVLEDIARMGGFAIAAHPDSSKQELSWTDWDQRVDGIEWLNGDSEWRDESPLQLSRALLAYAVRPEEALALMFDRPEALLRRWDEMTTRGRVVAVAAADAHSRIGLRAQEPYSGSFAVPLPGYEQVFRAFTIALPQLQMSRDPAADAAHVIDEIRAGHVFSSIDALGAQPAFSFEARSGASHAVAGDALLPKGPVQIEVRTQAPPDVRVSLIRDGTKVTDASGPSLEYQADSSPASYRVEVSLPGAPGQPPVPWIVSNPIYVGRDFASKSASAEHPRASATFVLYADGEAKGWTVEHSPESRAAFDVRRAVGGNQLSVRYALSGTAAQHPFAALVASAGGELRAYQRLTFTAQADRPMRVSVQVRAPGNGAEGQRWHRSVFLDDTLREISVAFTDMRPRGATSSATPILPDIQSVLFVVDAVNTPIGTAGQFSVDNVRYER